MFVAYLVVCSVNLSVCQAIAYPQPLQTLEQCQQVQSQATVSPGFFLVEQECLEVGKPV